MGNYVFCELNNLYSIHDEGVGQNRKIQWGILTIGLLKIDQNGKEWDNTIGGLNGEGCYNILESSEGGYFVTGFSSPSQILYPCSLVLCLMCSSVVVSSLFSPQNIFPTLAFQINNSTFAPLLDKIYFV